MSKGNCPFYKNNVCIVGEGRFSCSFESAFASYTECVPYKMGIAGKKKCQKCGYAWESASAGLQAIFGGNTTMSVIGTNPSKCPRCGQKI
jgi:hypothetical protein